jgi:hypothetical protein
MSSTLTATPVNSTASILTMTVTGQATNGVISSLQPQTTYQISVVSTTICGSSPASTPISVTTSPATVPPSAPPPQSRRVGRTWTPRARLTRSLLPGRRPIRATARSTSTWSRSPAATALAPPRRRGRERL